jgi:type IV secretory pathway component VirB8
MFMVTKYKKGSAWKRVHWDRWTLGRKIRHVIAVILSLMTVAAMFLIAAYVVLIVFGVYGFFLKFRDTVLLEFAHWLFD